MFKFLIVAVLVAAVAAKPSENVEKNVEKRAAIITDGAVLPLASTTVVHEPTLAKIGEYVQSVPTAISHQSQTIVHDRANVVTPIITPAVKTHVASIIPDYTYEHVPLVRSLPANYYPYSYYYY